MSETGRRRVSDASRFVRLCVLARLPGCRSRNVWLWALEGKGRLKKWCGELYVGEWAEVGEEGGEVVEFEVETSDLGLLERRNDVLRERNGEDECIVGLLGVCRLQLEYHSKSD